MATFLTPIVLAGGAATLAACGQPVGASQRSGSVEAAEAVNTDELLFGGKTIALFARAGRCFLKGHNGARETMLIPKAPCHFVRYDGKVVQHRYPDVAVMAAIMVVGTPVTAADRVTWRVPADKNCGTAAQGLLLRRKQIEVSSLVRSHGLACRDSGLDEKDYYAAAHP